MLSHCSSRYKKSTQVPRRLSSAVNIDLVRCSNAFVLHPLPCGFSLPATAGLVTQYANGAETSSVTTGNRWLCGIREYHVDFNVAFLCGVQGTWLPIHIGRGGQPPLLVKAYHRESGRLDSTHYRGLGSGQPSLASRVRTPHARP